MRIAILIGSVAVLACSNATSSPTEPQAAAPTWSPPPGTYLATQVVTIRSATPGARVHCTQDGSAATAASPSCQDPITVATTATLRAVATAAGYAPSAESTARYVIEPTAPEAAAPTFAPPGDTYASAQTVTISSATPGAVIHCTQDGTAASAASPTCAAPVVVSSSRTLRAVATAAGYAPSAESLATYTIQAPQVPAAAPIFAPPGATYSSAQTVTISSATAGAVIHCTQDGSAATADSPTCDAPIVVSATTTIRAVATAAGHTPSAEASATYTIQGADPRAATPTFAPPGGTYPSAQRVTISSATAGAVIHCTQDGTAASASSPTCGDPVLISSSVTLRAVAIATGHTPSLEGSATYTIGSATNADKLRALAAKRTWFAHMSVGSHIYTGENLDNASGLGGIVSANPGTGVTVPHYIYNPNEAQLTSGAVAGQFTHSYTGADTGDPVGKIHAFVASLGASFGGGLDYAALKFCYSDFRYNTTARNEEAWTEYQTHMDALDAAFPGRLIFWTVPLASTASDADNAARQVFNNRLRTRYGATGRVFDVALLESTDPDGNPVAGQSAPAMYSPYSFDGSHPNVLGANYLAQAYVDFLYGVEQRRAAAAGR